jgi:hypothetical protein
MTAHIHRIGSVTPAQHAPFGGPADPLTAADGDQVVTAAPLEEQAADSGRTTRAGWPPPCWSLTLYSGRTNYRPRAFCSSFLVIEDRPLTFFFFASL